MHFDVFNGDADGICALHQWRLAHPADSEKITGVKRDTLLLTRVHPARGDTVTVFDIALRDNVRDAQRILDAGATLTYFDHHEGADLPASPALTLHLDPSPSVCTSLLVDRELAGAYRPWAIAAAFGDNLHAVAAHMAATEGLPPADTVALEELGTLLNYNAYGDTLADLHFPPADLYLAIHPFADPMDCWRRAPQISALREAFTQDWVLAAGIAPAYEGGGAMAVHLPATAWARRIHGTLANRLAEDHPARAIAVLVDNLDHTVRVSVRAPKERPEGADRLCRAFPTGGGRALAAGITRLPRAEVSRFLEQLERAFPQAAGRSAS
jgi:DHHA1 domain